MLFISESLEKCKNILSIRKKFKLKYANIELPSTVDEVHGYHVQCYKNFTSVNRKYLCDDNSSLIDPAVSSPSPSAFISPPSTESPASTASSSTQTESGIKMRKKTKCNVIETEKVNKMHVSFIEIVDKAPETITTATTTVQQLQSLPHCVFCHKQKRTSKGRQLSLHILDMKTIKESLIPQARTLNDTELLKVFSGEVHDINRIKYHLLCKNEYVRKVKTILDDRPPTAWHEIRDCHREAFQEVCTYIDEHVIKNSHCVFLSFCHTLYNTALQKACEKYMRTSSVPTPLHVVTSKIEEIYSQDTQFITVQKKGYCT